MSPTTLERQAALKAFRDMVIEQVRPLFISKLQLAKGLAYVYRVTIGERREIPGSSLRDAPE